MTGSSTSVGARTPQISRERSQGGYAVPPPPRQVSRQFGHERVARPPPPELLARARAYAQARRPGATTSPTAASVPHSEQPAAAVPPKRLLLVDTDKAFGAQVSGWVGGKQEFEVVQVATLHNAGALLRAGGVDMIIATVELPDGNGLKLASDAAISHIPKLFLSPQASLYRSKMETSLLLLEKPVSPLKLRELVRSLAQPGTPKAVQSEPTADDDESGPQTIPLWSPSEASAPTRHFEDVWSDARAQLTRRDYEGAIETLKLARSMRPEDERVQQSLTRLQAMGFDVG